MLREYLVSGVEDPRINLQSILTRHFLTVAFSGDRFAELLEQELRFGMVINWARTMLDEVGGPDDLGAIRHALARGMDNAEGWHVPSFVSATMRMLPGAANGVDIPNYLDAVLDSERPAPVMNEPLLGTFQRAWHQVLQEAPPSGLSVVEPACGSANDYRFFEAFGLARIMTYTGFDLCETNVRNARELFPQARFELGNAFAIQAPNRAFDYCVVHDLFEHLSSPGIEAAAKEICRVTGRGLCLGFFNMHEGPEHSVQPVEDYHWNRLSLPQFRGLLEQQGFQAQVVHIATFLRWRFGCDQTHNPNAYTILAERPSPV